MLKLLISDPHCPEGEVWVEEVPLATKWSDIQIALRLFYPEVTEVTIQIMEEE